MTINKEKAKDLIIQSVQHLSESILLEENGWTEEHIQTFEYILNHDFDITFKEKK